jgi:hypothetical protein
LGSSRRRCCRQIARTGFKPLKQVGFRDAGATTRTSGSFAESRVRSSESWVRSSISWVFLGSIVGSFVEKRLKCAAIRYITNANGASSGTLLPPLCRPALHNPRECAAIRHIPRADVPLYDTRSGSSCVSTRVVISVRYVCRHTSVWRRKGRNAGRLAFPRPSFPLAWWMPGRHGHERRADASAVGCLREASWRLRKSSSQSFSVQLW